MKHSLTPTVLSFCMALGLLFGTALMAPAEAGHKTELVCEVITVDGVEFEAEFKFKPNGDGKAKFTVEGNAPMADAGIDWPAQSGGFAVLRTDTSGDGLV